MDKVAQYTDKAVELAMTYAPKLALALVTLIVGLWVVKGFVKLMGKVMRARNVDPTLTPFALSMIGWMGKALVFISVASMVGIETTSFVAVLGAAGLAVGLALQGSLANFAGGALILIFRPYEVGDLIETQGKLGVVKEIQIFTTILLSPENKTIILPNGAVSNGTITNYTRQGVIRVDLTVGVAYDADLKQAKEILLNILKEDDRVLAEPAPMVAVSELADSSVNLAVRPHVKPEHYWDVYFGTLESAKIALDAAEIGIPFPQRDVHVYQHGAAQLAA